MKRFFLYGAMAVTAIALIVWQLGNNKRKNAEKTQIVRESNSGSVPVLTQIAQRTDFEQSITANGKLEAIHQIDFTAESSGRMVAILVKEGSPVQAGQALARIDNQVVSADLQSAQATIDAAKRDLERYEQAFKTGGVTRKQVDDMRLQLQNAQSRYAQASKNAANTLLKSPIDGVINARYAEVGTYLSPGTKIFEIVNTSRLKLVVNIPENQVVQLRTGQQVSVTTNVFPEVTYQGRITFIAVKGDATLNYPVEVEIANVAGSELKAGMFGTAHFRLPKQEPALLIPRAAFYAGISNNDIFVLEQGKARGRKVVAGRVFGDKVEIREGLREGEVVITSGQVNLTDGTPVQAQK